MTQMPDGSAEPDDVSTTERPLAAWYPAPDDPTKLRYWDGSAWTAQEAPLPPPAARKAPTNPDQVRDATRTRIIAAASLAVLLLGVLATRVGFKLRLPILGLFDLVAIVLAVVAVTRSRTYRLPGTRPIAIVTLVIAVALPVLGAIVFVFFLFLLASSHV